MVGMPAPEAARAAAGLELAGTVATVTQVRQAARAAAGLAAGQAVLQTAMAATPTGLHGRGM